MSSGPDTSRVGVRDLARSWSAERSDHPELTAVFVSEVDSTQRLARTLLDQCVHEDEGPLPFVVAALAQSAGRGRHGRSWWSPRGAGLYASLVLPVAGSRALQELPLRTATALAEYLSSILGERCSIKWPNDLIVERRKIGGILIDAVSPPAPAERWAIVGVGLNFRDPEERGTGAATSVVEEAKSIGRDFPSFDQFVADVIASVWRALGSQSSDWVERFVRLSAHRPGDTLRFRAGDEDVEGRFVGFDEQGFLKIETANGPRVVRSGEVFSW